MVNSTGVDDPVLQISDLAVTYNTRDGPVEAVRDVSFEIGRGEAFGLVGESGCGKSTVAFSIVNALARNGRVSSGRIRFLGRDLVGLGEEDLLTQLGNQISMVFQDPAQSLNPSLRIDEQLMEVLTVHRRISSAEARSLSVEMLRRVSMPDPDVIMRRYPHQLSGGQQQRVIIAMAMLNQPALLIMDEPTTALDVTVEAAVLDLIDQLRKEYGKAVLYISHNLGVVARVCDRVGVMYAGSLVEQACVSDIFRTPLHPYTRALIRCIPKLGSTKLSDVLTPIRGSVPAAGSLPRGCPFSPRCDFAIEACRDEHPRSEEITPGHAVRCHVARQIATERPSRAVLRSAEPAQRRDESTDVLLKATELRTFYRQDRRPGTLGRGPRALVHAVDGISFELRSGQVLGIVGESGCGKSTLARTIIGLETSTDGALEFMGIDISRPIGTRSPELIKELQIVFQNPDSTLNPSFSVGMQIGRSLRLLRGMRRGSELREEVNKLLIAVRLNESYYTRMPSQLSGGERQRVAIARAIAAHPALVVCDEPISALDVSVQAAILSLLLDLQRERGISLVLISHDLSVVRYCSDYVGVMYMGQFVEYGPTASIYTPPYHPYTESLLAAVPVPDPDFKQERIRLEGTVPSPLAPPSGCRFHTRCPRRAQLPDGGHICAAERPPVVEAGGDHLIRCHIPLPLLRSVSPVIHPMEKLQ